MSKRIITYILPVLFCVGLLPSSALAQDADELYPKKEIQASTGDKISITGSRSGIPSGNYSGIAWIGDNRYIVVSDKKTNTDTEDTDSWQIISISTDEKGNPTAVAYEGNTPLKTEDGTEAVRRDAEGIVFVPKANSLNGLDASEGGTVFISSEGDQRILEYDLEGRLTGRELTIPQEMATDRIFNNYGFEALAYSPERRKFWTTTEQGLKADVTSPTTADNAVPTLLRIIRFGEDLQMEKQYAYKTEAPTAKKTSSKYAFGVPELTALPDGTLIVCEREFFVGDGLGVINSFTNINIYRAFPEETCETQFTVALKDLPEERFMRKELLTSIHTGISNIANYEGMCIGPKTQDGSINLLLINDSQNRYKSILGEYVMNITLTEKEDVTDSIGSIAVNQNDSALTYALNGSAVLRKTAGKAGIIIEKGKKYAYKNN